MNINEYIVGIVAVAVYIICLVLHAIKFIPNKFLPLIAVVLGVAFNFWFQAKIDFVVFVGGLASGLSAVGIDNVIDFIKTSVKDDSSERDDE